MTTMRYLGVWRLLQGARSAAAAALALTILAFLGYATVFAQPALAFESLTVGDYIALADVPNSAEYDEALISLKAKSSNAKVVACSARKPESYTGKRELFAYAKGFGDATVTVTWTLRESAFNEKTGKVTQVKRKHSKSFDYSVREAAVKKQACDHIFAGKEYTLSGLFKGMRSLNHISYFSGQGKGAFTAGEGYTVNANGKKICFKEGASNLTLSYRYNGTTYPIRITAIHSQESLSNKVITAVKKLCYYPSSLKIKSVSLRSSKLYVSFSAVNLAGVRNNSRVCAYFDHGVFKFDKLS